MQTNKIVKDLFIFSVDCLKNEKYEIVVESWAGEVRGTFETINNESLQKIAVINFPPLRKKII